MDYFGIKIAAIQERCKEVGIKHVRFPVRDFDPFDLRMKLPKAVSKLAGAHDPRTGIAYIHCTAGRPWKMFGVSRPDSWDFSYTPLMRHYAEMHIGSSILRLPDTSLTPASRQVCVK